MKALTVQGKYPRLFCLGLKHLETRGFRTKHRGDLLICAGKKSDLHPGCAVAVVKLNDVRPMERADEVAAMVAYSPGKFVWETSDLLHITNPFPVRGYPGLFDVTLPTDTDVQPYEHLHPRTDFYRSQPPVCERDLILSSMLYLVVTSFRGMWFSEFFGKYRKRFFDKYGKAARINEVDFSTIEKFTLSQAIVYLTYHLDRVLFHELLFLGHQKNISLEDLMVRSDGDPATVIFPGDWINHWSSVIQVSPEIIIQHYGDSTDYSRPPVLRRAATV